MSTAALPEPGAASPGGAYSGSHKSAQRLPPATAHLRLPPATTTPLGAKGESHGVWKASRSRSKSQEQAKEKEGGPAPKRKGKSIIYQRPVPTTPAKAMPDLRRATAKAIMEKAKPFADPRPKPKPFAEPRPKAFAEPRSKPFAELRVKATVAAAPAASAAPVAAAPAASAAPQRPKRSASCIIAWGDCPWRRGISGPRDWEL